MLEALLSLCVVVCVGGGNFYCSKGEDADVALAQAEIEDLRPDVIRKLKLKVRANFLTHNGDGVLSA
jgi:hypothetical protein